MAHTDHYLDDPKGYRFSASQISTYMACPRKWAWTYLMALRGPGTASTELGSAMHRQLENYLKGGELDFTEPAGNVAASGLQHLPAPCTPGVEVESSFEFTERHRWYGLKDVRIPGLVPHVMDHKSTSSLGWAKEPEDLLTDPQAILYAKDELRQSAWSDCVDLTWIYYQTKKPNKSKTTHLRIYEAQVETAFEVMEEAADEALDIARGARGLDGEELRGYILASPFNAGHCEDFGGCQFRGLCNLSPEQRFGARMKQSMSSLAARLKAKQQTADVATPSPAAPVQVPLPVNPPEYQPPPTAPALDAPKPPTKAQQKAQAKAAATPLTQDDPPRVFGLCINCLPVGVTYTLAETYFARAKVLIESEMQLSDYRFADFGKGPGILVQAVTKLLDDEFPEYPIVLDTRTPEGAICATLFRSRATKIVLGF